MDSNPLHPKVIPLYVSSAHQPWGKPSRTALAARLQALNRLSAISPDKPTSELVVSSCAPHEAVLASNPTVSILNHIQAQVIEVDPTIVDFYANLHRDGLPFELRVLSVASPQPLRVHPSSEDAKKLAEELSFTNLRAKSVMMVAINHSNILFGLQAAADIVNELTRVPEFADAVGRPETDRFVHTVKTSYATPKDISVIVTSLMLREKEFIAGCLSRASKRLQKMPPEAVTETDKRLIALQEMYPSDASCFAIYFLNSVHLQPGQAVFIQTGEPYCVLDGDLVETTSRSDAVVLGGLTKNNTSTNLFLDALTYDDSPVEVSSGERVSDYGVSYVPPVPEYQLLEFKLSAGISQRMVETLAPSIIVVLSGEGLINVDGESQLLPLRVGSVYYLSPQTSFLVTAREDVSSTIHFVQVGVNESAAPSSSSSCSIM